MPKSLALGIVIGASVASSVGGSFKTIEEKSARLGRALKKARLGESLASDVIKYKTTLDQLKARQAALGYSSERLNRGIAEVSRRYREAKRAARSYGIQIGDVVREQRRLKDAAERADRTLKRIEQRQRNRALRGELRGKALGMMGAAYALSKPVRGAMEFATAKVRLRTVINAEDTAKALKESSRHALNFARKSLATETELIDIEYALNSAGLEASASRVGSEVVHRVATITSGVPETVGEVVATVFNNLGGSLEGGVQERLTRIGELLTKTQFKFQIRDFGQLGESMKLAAPALAQYNMNLEQGLTLLGMLNTSGLQGSRAGMALAATFRQLSKGAEEFGFGIERDASGGLDFIATLQNLSDVIGGFDNLDQETIDRLQKAFGEEGIRGVVLLGQKLKALRRAQDDVAQGSRNIIDKNYELFLQDPAGQWSKTTKNIRLVGDAIANTLLPGLNMVLEPLSSGAAWVGRLVEEYPALGKVIGGATVGFIGLTTWTVAAKYAGTLLSDVWLTGKGVLDFFRISTLRTNAALLLYKARVIGAAIATRAFALGGALKSAGPMLMGLATKVIPMVIGGVRAMSIAFMSSPVGLIVGGIALVAGLVIANWEKVKGFFLTIWEPIKPYWEKFVAWIGAIWEKISDPFKLVAEFGKKIGGSISSFFGGEEGITVKMQPVMQPLKTAAAAATIAASAAVSPAAAAPLPPLNISIGDIIIHAAPGMDERSLASQVRDQVEQAMADSLYRYEAERRGRLYD